MPSFIQSNAKVYLKDVLSSTAWAWATFRISPDIELNANIETSSNQTFFVLKNGTQIERMIITATWWVATIVKRWIKQDGTTEDSDLKKTWNDGTIGYITVSPTDFVSTGKLDTAWGLRNTMWTPQNIGATNGSTAITVADTFWWFNGASISGTGIPGGTTIVSFVPNTSAVLSAEYTGTTWTVSVTVWRNAAIEIDTTNAEVKRIIESSSATPPDSSLIQIIDPATRKRSEVPYSVVKNSLSVAWAYTQSVQIGETISWSLVYPMAVVNNIKYSPSGFSTTAGSVLTQWIRFTVPYGCTLGIVKSNANASTWSAVFQLRDDTGTILTSQTVTNGTNSANMNYVLTAWVTYRLVINDTVNFGNNRYSLAVASYQALFPYAIGGTANWANDAVNCFNFSEINLDFLWKAYLARANRYIEKEFAYLAWFVTWPKAINDSVVLNANAGLFVSWFTGLTNDTEYYITNTAWVLGTTPGTVPSKVWLAMGTTWIIIKKEYVIFDELVSNTWGTGTLNGTNFTWARDYFVILASFQLDSWWAWWWWIQLEANTLVANNTLKYKFFARAWQVSRAYATNGVGNNGAQGRIQAFYYD